MDSVSTQRKHVAGALRTSVDALAHAFRPGELAYLAATSKAELPIRDRLAWLLHGALGDDFVVSREWRRADLAVLVNDVVIAQIEAKALYTFDILKEVRAGWPQTGYLGRLKHDAEKMTALAQSDRWLLSLITDVRGFIPQHLARHVVKYSSGITTAILVPGEELRDSTQHLWVEALNRAFGCECTTSLRVDGGSIWDLDVSVDICLTGPLT
jgi:hypothetical protein